MSIRIKLPESCCEPVLREGARIHQTEEFLMLPEQMLSGGRALHKAKVRDSFNFVDHPQVELDASCTVVSRYACDCPDYRSNRRFCAHCAALVLALEEALYLCSAANETEVVNKTAHTGEAPQIEIENSPGLLDFSYTFCNSASDLYPGIAEPRIPLEPYLLVFGDNARARMLYNSNPTWGGSCFGITITATMFYHLESNVAVCHFNDNAKIPSNLNLSDLNKDWNITLHRFIEMAHVLQACNSISYCRSRNLADPNCMEALAQRVTAFQNGKGDPVGMSVWKNPGFEGGHSVLPYYLEKVSQTEERLHIYDPNWPLVTRYAYFKKDMQGKYISWRFPMSNHEVYSSETGGKLSFDPYEVYNAAWNHRGNPKEDNLLITKAGVAIMDADGVMLARVTESGVVSFRDEIYQILVTDGNSNDSVMISLPAGMYTFRMEDPQQNELTVKLAGVELSMTVTTTAREAIVCVKDEDMIALAQIPATDSRYIIDILNTAGEIHEEVSLEGITDQDDLCLVQKNGRLFASGVTEQASLCINKESVSLHWIGQLTKEVLQPEQEMERIMNTASDKIPKENQP